MTRFLVAILLLTPTYARADQRTRGVDYMSKVKPLLALKCYACHGALKQKSGLRLETRGLMLKGGDGGAVIVPGNVKASRLLHRITAKNDERMPPESQGSALTADEIDLIRRWINDGAKAPDESVPASPKDHWAFQAVVRPAVPAVGNSAWVRNPIDAFLARRHHKRELTPQPEAPRVILLRRLYLDLIGIPPTATEIADFVNDESSDLYEQTVRRLLDDPRHGERWGRHWMDIWRYSDWWGLGAQLRNSQKHIWHWRDWIIESLNNDTPYDEMVRQMLAADELYPNDLDKLRATGFLARNYFLFNRPQWMEETVEHVSKGFLGLTMNCSKCHDHKFDPIEQTDFYRMRAFFEPYHVRLDVLPGEADLARDGIPRVFDGLPDDPTYVYVRGDEKNPDKSKVIKPGVPALLEFESLKIEPVALPKQAWQPGNRSWVAEAHIAAVRKKLELAQAELKKASGALAQAKQLAEKAKKAKPKVVTSKKTATVLVDEDFTSLDTDRWQLFGGNWKHEPGKLSQRKDGATRSVLRLTAKPPQDFEATVQFTILGGSKWRSVGLSFDAAAIDPTNDRVAKYHEQNVYASAHAGGSKIHASYNNGGKWHYPPAPNVRGLPVELNRKHTLQVRVRGTLINVAFNGQPVIACRTPLPRRDGLMQLTTFDALTVFHGIKISELGSGVSLREPSTAPMSIAGAQTNVGKAIAAQKVASANVELARAELKSAEQRAAALQASDEDRRTMTVAAINAERLVKVAKQHHAAAVAEQALLQAASDKKAAAQKTLKTAQAALAKAEATAKAEVKPDDTFTPFVGAEWTPTRFFSSGRDDPTVKFHPNSTGRRTALARWITDRRNPLVARVAVNHIWARHMGQPLVPTVFDFGRKGTPPTHPKLLDWLASELMDNAWSMKHIHRLIVTSAAYRMSSSVAGAESNVAKDKENHNWWRRVPIRLESQVVRDSLLVMAGTLDAKMGGPPVPRNQQAQSKRRSLYFFHSNNERNLFLTTFDEALVKDCYRREQSIVPQQALALTNSELVLDSSQSIAKRLSTQSKDEADFIRQAFAVVLGITAGEEEIDTSRAAIAQWRELEGVNEERARANLVWALINHNDFVTLR